jgi:hypothetical protein
MALIEVEAPADRTLAFVARFGGPENPLLDDAEDDDIEAGVDLMGQRVLVAALLFRMGSTRSVTPMSSMPSTSLTGESAVVFAGSMSVPVMFLMLLVIVVGCGASGGGGGTSPTRLCHLVSTGECEAQRCHPIPLQSGLST